MTKRSFLSRPFSLDWLLGAVCLVVLFYMGGFLADGDTGVHIRAGQYMLEHRAFIREDIFSYFTPSVPWHNHEWLAQVWMALTFGLGGMKAVVLSYCFLAAIVLFLLFRQIESKAGAWTSVFIFAFVFLNLSVHFLARPHLFTMLFVVIWKKVLDDFQEGKANRLLILPPLMLLWVNLHGAFIMGLLLLGIYGVGNFLPGMLDGKKGKDKNLDRARAIVITVLACFFVTALNPDGIYIWKYIFGFTSNKLLMDRIAEFKSTDFHQFAPLIHFVYLSLVVIAAARTPLTFIEWMLTAVFASMALYSTRHLPLFTIVTAPILAGRLPELWQSLKTRFPSFSFKPLPPFAAGAVTVFNTIVLAALLGGGIYAVTMKSYSYDEGLKPVKAVEFIQEHQVPGRIFASDEYGDYLIYKLWPDTKVFIYGWFNDTGAMERFRDYLEMGLVRPKWQETFEKHQINAVLSATEAPLTGALMVHSGWKLIYSDSTASLFIRNLPANQSWIQQSSGIPLAEAKPL